MRKISISLLVLLTGASCFAQTPLHGLVAGQSVRTDVERIAGKPVTVHSQTLVEYNPEVFDSKTWGNNVAKMYVQYRIDSPIVERIELMLGKPVSRSDSFKALEASTSAAHQPNMPEQPASRGKNGVRLVEYFGAPYYIVLTYEGADVNSGVARSARYSKLLFDSTVSSLGSSTNSNANSNTGSNSSASAGTAPNGSVTGVWSGTWTNSNGDSGKSTINLVEESGGMIAGEEETFSMGAASAAHRAGWTILNGHRAGNLLTWEYHNQTNGCRDYTVRWELSPDGKSANGTYKVTDHCTKQTYTGSYLNYHR
jgi:hypothetical protein